LAEVSELQTPHGPLVLPSFLPDATRGVVRGLTAGDLEACGVRALVMNVFHLMRRPGVTTVEALGGLHAMTGWTGPVVTDSGGFQAFSLIRQDPRRGRKDDEGLTFRSGDGGKKIRLTPESSVERQLRLGADVVIGLDDCTHVEDSLQAQEDSVRRTVAWARRGKEALEAFVDQREIPPEKRPLHFAVIQGGGSTALRTRCTEALLETGFDGFGFGGWPLDGTGRFLAESLALVRDLVPPDRPLFALGVGHPDNVVKAVRLGYRLFDSSMPTKDARHGRLYLRPEDGGPRSARKPDSSVAFLYMGDEAHRREARPVSPSCDCLACRSVSRGYLSHLYRVHDPLYSRLATIHNLRFMTGLLERLGSEG
jgi:queuine tRNA-ribosyltransferase